MTAYLCPLFQDPQFTDNDEFLAGGLLWFYEAGSSTLATAYTDELGAVAWSNPIVLDSRGSSGGTIWLAAGISYRIVLENKPVYGQTHGAVITDHDYITGINDPATLTPSSNWVLFSGEPTYIGATSFSVLGDQRDIFAERRRIYTENSGGVIYSSVVSSVYAAGITTITVVNDSGTLDVGLSAVYYAFELPLALPVDLYSYAQTLAAPGYLHLSNGLLIQWGNTAVATPGPDTITYPIAFDTVYTVVGQPVGTEAAYAVLSLITTTNFLVTQHGASENANLSWVAIGVKSV